MQRIVANGRLVYYREAASPEYWDDVWARQETQQLYADAKAGRLAYYEDMFPKYLPRDGKILEAGCGLGQFVMALRARGYDAEGVDYARRTIDEVKAKFPDLPIRWGDVTQLDVPHGHYKGYISLGVMEHLKDGPKPFLKEAHRILSNDGVALISIPNMNWLRKTKMTLGQFGNQAPDRMAFYQYVYPTREFDGMLNAAGFDVNAHHQYGGYKGVKDEISGLSKMFEWPQGWRLRKWLMNSSWANNHMGHMMMFVCKKSPAPTST